MICKVGINGFGRIGRLFLRSAIDNDNFDFKVINDLTSIETLAHLIKYDSTHGKLKGTVEIEGDYLIINGKKIRVLSEKDPSKLPWAEYGVEAVVEATGLFRKRNDVMKHLEAGARKAVVTAPATDPDWTVVMGVNHQEYDDEKHNIISNASCTTNCLAPVAKVLMDNFGISRGIMTTIHAYTNDQRILDLPHKDLRRARAAALSMIPTTTGAAKAVALVLPELKGKLTGLAIRVPTPNVSLVDLVVMLERETSSEEINAAFKVASETSLKNILGYSEEKLVSIDFLGSDNSGYVDAEYTMVSGKMAKILAWYDNEYGYSCRIRDLLLYMYK